jgi:cell division protein FtsQ
MPTGMDKKLERMRKFYLYGLNKAGWNKYSSISVEFDNQIICKRVKEKF